MTEQLVFFSEISHAISARRYVFLVTLIAVDDEDDDNVGILCVESTAV